MRKIAVIGDELSIRGFSSVGFATFPVLDDKEASDAVNSCTENGYAIVYIMEEFFALKEFSTSIETAGVFPIFIPIPSATGTTGVGMERLREMAIRAIGSEFILGDVEHE